MKGNRCTSSNSPIVRSTLVDQVFAMEIINLTRCRSLSELLCWSWYHCRCPAGGKSSSLLQPSKDPWEVPIAVHDTHGPPATLYKTLN